MLTNNVVKYFVIEVTIIAFLVGIACGVWIGLMLKKHQVNQIITECNKQIHSTSTALFAPTIK